MSHDSRIRFSLERPPADRSHPAEVPLSKPQELDNPPPWEPRFEDLSTLSLPSCRRPLDPPPPCIRSHDFPAFRIPAVSDKLPDGFRPLYPYNTFEVHGIGRADWLRFLEDLGIAARLSSQGLNAVGSRVPLLAHRIFPSRAPGAVYDERFARCPVEEVRALIQIWNQCAFERRKIRVTLQVLPNIGMRGRKSYTLVIESL